MEPDLYNNALQLYVKTLICTHRWSIRPDERERTNHTFKALGCPARLNEALARDGCDVNNVRTTKHNSKHNHSVGRDELFSFANSRKIHSPGIKRVVKIMWQGGSKRQKVLRYLKEASEKPMQTKGVENIIAEMRRETYTSPDDNVRVSELLEDSAEGPGNAVNIFCDPGPAASRSRRRIREERRASSLRRYALMLRTERIS